MAGKSLLGSLEMISIIALLLKYRASVCNVKEVNYSPTTLGKKNHHQGSFFVFEKSDI
ncbi:MAG: hypothetical protein ACP5N9_00365 [Candidatus Bilamarchaeum sp.]|jgi:hypothetical protein